MDKWSAGGSSRVQAAISPDSLFLLLISVIGFDKLLLVIVGDDIDQLFGFWVRSMLQS